MDLVCVHIIIRGVTANPGTRVRAMDFEMNIRYADNSLSIDSEEMKQLQSCAAENNIVVCLGYSEKKGNSLYIGQCTIDNNGELLMSRRKLKPVHLERTLFGDGNGPSLNNVAATSIGKVGQLSCAVCTIASYLLFFLLITLSSITIVNLKLGSLQPTSCI